jgi:hypothetical protein
MTASVARGDQAPVYIAHTHVRPRGSGKNERVEPVLADHPLQSLGAGLRGQKVSIQRGVEAAAVDERLPFSIQIPHQVRSEADGVKGRRDVVLRHEVRAPFGYRSGSS